MSDAAAQYYLSANALYRHKTRWRLEQSGQLSVASSSKTSTRSLSPADTLISSKSSERLSEPYSIDGSLTTSPKATPTVPPALLKNPDGPVLPTSKLRLPPRSKHPKHPGFIYLWQEHDKAHISVKNAVRNIRDLVDDQDPPRLTMTKRPRRTERDLIAELWVEGPKRTDAITRYWKAKARLDKIKGYLCYFDAKYDAQSPQTPAQALPSLFSPGRSGDSSPLTPLPSPLPSVLTPIKPAEDLTPASEDGGRRSRRILQRETLKRRREDDSGTSTTEEPVPKRQVKRLRLKHKSDDTPSDTVETPASPNNALDLTLN